MEFTIAFGYCDKNGLLQTYEDGTEKIFMKTINAKSKKRALVMLYAEERFAKKPDYLVIIGEDEYDELEDYE